MAVSTGSVQGLLSVVRARGQGIESDCCLVSLALEALVGAVHVLHTSRAPPRGPELRALLEGYFRVLNSDWPAGPSSGPEEALVTLRVSMLGAYRLPGKGRSPEMMEGLYQAVWEEGCLQGFSQGLNWTFHRRHPHDAGV